jgi:hypothetical protein
LFRHPGGVIGGPFPIEWVTPRPGSPPDDWPWRVESPGPFPETPDDAPDVSWLAEEPEEDPVEAVVGDEAVVVDVLVPEPLDEGAVVVVVPVVVVDLPEEGTVAVDLPEEGTVAVDLPEDGTVAVDLPEDGTVVVDLPEEGTLMVAEPSPRAEAAGPEVVRIGEAGPPAPEVLGALTAAGFAEEDGAAFEDGTGALAAPIGGAPAGAAAPAPACDPGWVAPARGWTMPDTSG